MRDEGVGKAEQFSTGGRGTGVVGLVITALLLVYGVLDRNAGYPAWLWPLLLLVGVVIWAVLVRPAIVIDGPDLELRNILHSRWVPFARITDVRVGQVTVVRADGRKYVGSGVSRSRRQVHLDLKREAESVGVERYSYGGVVEFRLNRLASQARELSTGEPPAVRQAWAWPEIAAIVALAAATVVLAVA